MLSIIFYFTGMEFTGIYTCFLIISVIFTMTSIPNVHLQESSWVWAFQWTKALYIGTPPVTGWDHTQNDPYVFYSDQYRHVLKELWDSDAPNSMELPHMIPSTLISGKTESSKENMLWTYIDVLGCSQGVEMYHCMILFIYNDTQQLHLFTPFSLGSLSLSSE